MRRYDAGKHVKGRKRHILVDTLGLLMAVVVTSAGVSDAAGAKLLLKCLGEPAKSSAASGWMERIAVTCTNG